LKEVIILLFNFEIFVGLAVGEEISNIISLSVSTEIFGVKFTMPTYAPDKSMIYS